MDFSNSAFRNDAPSRVSTDTMSHSNLVMACRWEWTSNPEPYITSANRIPTSSSTVQPSSASTFNNFRTKRFATCQGRLYHQLLCSHRIRTDLVEDCGANCLEPMDGALGSAFICKECIQEKATKVWEARQTEHNAKYPPTEHMTQEQYDQWYVEHRQLEAEFSRHQHLYESDLRARTRPSNICSALDASKEEMEFANELDSLSLSLMSSNTSNADQYPQSQARSRVALPTDASEQLHWDLNTLALDRGSCGIEYTASQLANRMPENREPDPHELWRKPRNHD